MKRSTPVLWASMGLEKLSRGGIHVLIIVMRVVLLFFPQHGPAWCLLGHLLVKNKQYADALPCLRQALEKGCTTAQVHADLAQVYTHSHRLMAAEKSLRCALNINPSNPTWWLGLGIILSKRQHRESAIHAFERAMHLDPNRVDPLFHLGCLYLEPAYVNALKAEAFFRQALRIDPHHEGSLTFLGQALGHLGRLDEAAFLYKQILTLYPNNIFALENLAMLGRMPKENLEAKLPDPARGQPHELAYNYFVIAKINTKNNNPTDAFACYQTGNAIMRQSFIYDIGQDVVQFQHTQSVFDSAFFADRHEWGDPSGKPIFILGMPRSGTTLIEQILAAHPLCHGGGERLEILELVNSMGIFSHTYQVYPEAAQELNAYTVRILGQSYVQGLTLINSGASRITDKMPHNFRYIGLIHLLLPNAPIIHCRRHPMDTCLSIYQQLFADHHPYAYDLTELGQYYRIYHQLMQHWQKTLPGRMLEIQYEEVVAHPEKMIRRILDHCGLPWDERCLDFHTVNRQVDTASFIEVRQPLYRTSVGRWQTYEKQLQPLRQALGDVL
ncbi:MAG: TPR REGION protein [Magnetococcales bacterium]|nr:TPR REGION protein [Magnetococcales bacterium]HIJ84460.1 tetratricopeptide repeat protein [Magnetococcales bacterium]